MSTGSRNQTVQLYRYDDKRFHVGNNAHAPISHNFIKINEDKLTKSINETENALKTTKNQHPTSEFPQSIFNLTHAQWPRDIIAKRK